METARDKQWMHQEILTAAWNIRQESAWSSEQSQEFWRKLHFDTRSNRSEIRLGLFIMESFAVICLPKKYTKRLR